MRRCANASSLLGRESQEMASNDLQRTPTDSNDLIYQNKHDYDTTNAILLGSIKAIFFIAHFQTKLSWIEPQDLGHWNSQPEAKSKKQELDNKNGEAVKGAFVCLRGSALWTTNSLFYTFWRNWRTRWPKFRHPP